MKFIIYRSSQDKLISQCRTGHEQARRRLYEAHAAKMLGLCKRYINMPDQAEDVMIVGFTKIFEKIGQFKHEGSFEGWMRRIMVNECLTYIRKNKNMYLEVDIATADRAPDLQQLETQLEESDLLQIIQELPTGYQTVFNLYAIEGYSHKEIGSMLEISENTSKSQLSRARALLQNKLLKLERATDAIRKGS